MLTHATYIGGDAVRRRSRAREIGGLRRTRQGRKGWLDISVHNVRLRQVVVEERSVLRRDEASG